MQGPPGLTKVIDPLTHTMSYKYISGGLLSQVLDYRGTLAKATDALQHVWEYSYDGTNRNVAVTDPLGRVTSVLFNFDDEVTTAFSASGRTTGYTYDSRGNVTAVIDPLGNQVRLTYDNRGKLVSVIDERNNTTTIGYDELYRPTTIVDPAGNASTMTYDSKGNMVDTVDRSGRHTVFTCDAVNRPSQVSYADATVTPTYNAASSVTRIDDTQSGFVQWSYDDANRVLSETTPNGVVSYGYNIANQRTSMTAANRPVVTYGYDTAGRLQTIGQGAETFSYSYDTLSRRASLQRPNGVTTSYSYDQISRLTRLLHSNAQNQALDDFNYSYNIDDEVESISSLFGDQSLPATKTAEPADGANRIARFDASALAFDTEGQTVSNTTNQGATSYEWDARGRMKRATLPSGQQASYAYDALGRRSSRTTPAGTTTFLYDGPEVVLDQGSDSSLVDYLNGPAMDEKLRQSSPGGPLYFLQNHSESTIALLDASAGVVERMQYEAFGQGAGSTLTRYGYTGRERDALTGLMYYRSPWYDPQQGRFVSEDPIGIEGGLNLYAFVDDDPLNSRDALGLKMCKEDCAALRADILRKDTLLLYELRKYDPVEDAKGGHPSKYSKGGKTKPKGHLEEMTGYINGIKQDITKYVKKCIKDNDEDPKNPPIPRWVDEMANRKVPVPIVNPKTMLEYQLEEEAWRRQARAWQALLEADILAASLVVPYLAPALRSLGSSDGLSPTNHNLLGG